MSKLRKFLSDKVVLIVMIPGIIGMHLGWSAIQNMESLVSKEEKREMPIFIIFRELKEKFLENTNKTE